MNEDDLTVYPMDDIPFLNLARYHFGYRWGYSSGPMQISNSNWIKELRTYFQKRP